MIKKNLLLFGGIVILIVAAIFLVNYPPEKESFTVNPILLKLNLPLNGESISKVKINNDKEKRQEFKIEIKGLENIVSTKEKEFFLEPNEVREIEVNFKDNLNKVEVYTGEFIVKTTSLERKIPIILNIEDKKRIFSIIQEDIPSYSNVYPGGKFGINLKIFNLEDEYSHNINIKYSIKNFKDELIFSDEEETIVEGNLGLTKIINIDKTVPQGEYIFISSIEYNETKSIASYLFTISKKESEFLSKNIEFLIIIILIFIVGILISFFYFIRARGSLITSLKRQQGNELKRNLDLIRSFEREIKKAEKSPQGKRRIKSLRKSKKKILEKIKSKQKKQISELKKLNKRGRKSDMQKQIDSWRREGYKMFETKKEMEKISKKDMEKSVEDWKKKGYNTNVFDN